MKKNLELLNNIKVGDTVTLTNTRPIAWNKKGEMNMFLGTNQIVIELEGTRVKFKNKSSSKWTFRLNEIVAVNGINVYYQSETILNSELFPIY